MAVDLVGNEYEIGDLVSYGAEWTGGVGRVTKITEPENEWSPSYITIFLVYHTYTNPRTLVTITGRKAVILEKAIATIRQLEQAASPEPQSETQGPYVHVESVYRVGLRDDE